MYERRCWASVLLGAVTTTRDDDGPERWPGLELLRGRVEDVSCELLDGRAEDGGRPARRRRPRKLVLVVLTCNATTHWYARGNRPGATSPGTWVRIPLRSAWPLFSHYFCHVACRRRCMYLCRHRQQIKKHLLNIKFLYNFPVHPFAYRNWPEIRLAPSHLYTYLHTTNPASRNRICSCAATEYYKRPKSGFKG